MEESRLAHEKEVARIKLKRKVLRKNLNLVGTVVFAWVVFMAFVWAFVWIVENSPD